MTPLTPDALQRLERYLAQVRAALGGCRSVSAAEVERDVLEHIDSSFQGAGGPVSLADLEAVLGRLGSPSQWVPEDDRAGWRRAVHYLRSGPEDWRLAYLAFSVLLVGLLLPGTFLVCCPASFLLARAALSVAEARGEELGAQRWLLYPALLPGHLGLLAVLFLGPAWPAWVLGNTLELWNGYKGWVQIVAGALSPREWVATYVLLSALGLWWLALGTVLRFRPRWLAALFYPFALRGWRRAPAVLSCTGLGLVVLCSGLLLRVWTNAGVLF